jgi:hypothetical protein
MTAKLPQEDRASSAGRDSRPKRSWISDTCGWMASHARAYPSMIPSRVSCSEIRSSPLARVAAVRKASAALSCRVRSSARRSWLIVARVPRRPPRSAPAKPTTIVHQDIACRSSPLAASRSPIHLTRSDSVGKHQLRPLSSGLAWSSGDRTASRSGAAFLMERCLPAGRFAGGAGAGRRAGDRRRRESLRPHLWQVLRYA